MYQPQRPIVKTINVTPSEYVLLQAARREALADATKLGIPNAPMPVSWRHGWTSTLTIHRRDRDGSLLATVRVEDPNGIARYIRKIRPVTTHPRASERIIRLRQG